MRKNSRQKPPGRNRRASLVTPARLALLGLCLLLCGFPALAQSPQTPAPPAAASDLPDAPTAAPQHADAHLPGAISGTIVDPSGAAVAGAHIVLTSDDKSPKQEVISGDDGQFSFTGIAPGPFQITVTSDLFTTQKVSAILHPGE